MGETIPKPDILRTAHHEAAHAFVAMEFGIVFDRIVLENSCAGRVEHYGIDSDKLIYDERIALAVSAYAGPIAELKYLGGDDGYIFGASMQDDFDAEVKLIELIEDEKSNEDDLEDCKRRCCAIARDLIGDRKNWRIIQCFARKLTHDMSLTYLEACEIIQDIDRETRDETDET